MGSGADTVSGEQRDGLGDTGCGSGGRSVAEELCGDSPAEL